MFKNHYDRMRPGATPERVLSLARMIQQKPMGQMEVAKRCELNDNVQTASEGIRYMISAAEELGLIENREGKYQFVAEPTAIATPKNFRRYVASKALTKESTTFFKVTQWFVASNKEVLPLSKFATFAAEIAKAGIDHVDENDVLGWRFWMRFLGIAYQYQTTLIPNMCIRLQDAMQDFADGQEIGCGEFLNWLKTHVPEAASSCSKDGLCLAISNGLRTLHDLGKIEMISANDAEKVYLYPLSGVRLNEFSAIVVKEAIRDELD